MACRRSSPLIPILLSVVAAGCGPTATAPDTTPQTPAGAPPSATATAGAPRRPPERPPLPPPGPPAGLERRLPGSAVATRPAPPPLVLPPFPELGDDTPVDEALVALRRRLELIAATAPASGGRR